MKSSHRGGAAGIVAAFLIAVVAACGEDPVSLEFEQVEEVSFASAFVTPDSQVLMVDLDQMTETESGVWIQDIVEAVGDTALEGDTMYVSYTGWLRDGVTFDSGDFTFIFFDGRTAIGGFHYGTQGQQIGSQRLVVIPPEWAYGANSVGPIYPGAILVFSIQLDSIHTGVAP